MIVLNLFGSRSEPPEVIHPARSPRRRRASAADHPAAVPAAPSPATPSPATANPATPSPAGVIPLALLLGTLLGVLLGTVAALTAPPLAASAHAVLTAAAPAQGSVVATAPATVRMTFSEPVRIVPGRTQVLGPDGKRINDGDPVGTGTELSIALLRTDRPLGTYLVSFRVISADSHPIAGSFTFSVGAPSAAAPKAAREGAHPVVAAAVPVSKYLGYAGLALVIGPILVLARLWPRRLSRRWPVRLVWTGLALLTLSTVAALWLQAPYTTGAGPFDVSGVELEQVVTDRFGFALLARLAVVAALAAVLRLALDSGHGLRRRAGRGPLTVLGVLGVVGLATWPASGHPAASPLPLVMAAADVVHLASMAVWLGGLLMLVGFLLRLADARELALILPAWSRWAALAVYWLIAGGVTQALIEAGDLRNLPDTRYGQLLLVKVGLLAVVLAIAAYSRRSVRRLMRPAEPPRAAEPPCPAEPPRAARLRRAAGAEVAVTAVVLAASAVLVQTAPGRTAGVETAARAQAEGFSTTLTSSIYSVQFEIFPAQVGPHNTLHAFLYTPDGRPAEAAEWKVTGALPGSGIEPIDNPVVTIRGNQGIGAVNFPLAGRWQLRLTIRVSETEQATVTTTVPVG